MEQEAGFVGIAGIEFTMADEKKYAVASPLEELHGLRMRGVEERLERDAFTSFNDLF